jgi:hypothetical protein
MSTENGAANALQAKIAEELMIQNKVGRNVCQAACNVKTIR